MALRLKSSSGPGHFSIWQSGDEGPDLFMATADGVTDEDFAEILEGEHMHANFAFTERGVYEVTFEAVARLPGGDLVASGDVTYHFLVHHNVASQIEVVVPSNVTSGVPFVLTVTAKDSVGNTVSNYDGIVHFTSSDGAAILPSNSSLLNGTGFFAAVLKSTGPQTITATDTITASITGDAAITVNALPGVATHFTVSAPIDSVAGNAFVFVVTALDQSNVTATGYLGTVHVASSDPQSLLPPSMTLTNGIGFFVAILRTAGTQTITATDATTASINGTSNSVSVAVSALHHFGFTSVAVRRHHGQQLRLHRRCSGCLQQHRANLQRHGPVHEQRQRRPHAACATRR